MKKSKKENNTAVTKNKSKKIAEKRYFRNQQAFSGKDESDKKSRVFSDKEREKIQNSVHNRNVATLYDPEVINNYDNFDKNLIVLLKPYSYEAEQFRILKSKIFHSTSEKTLRSFMITSAIPNEGKSFVAANLAISIAQNLNEHVLILDADMRKPCIHKLFGFGDMAGLSEHLSNGIPLNSIFLKTQVRKLSILPAGKRPPNPYELLSSQNMIKLLKELKQRYSDRYIIIDSPPPALTAETTAMSNLVDGVLLVVEYGRTPINLVSEVVKTLGKEKVTSIIFNKFNIRLSNFCAYGKYSQYSKYYDCYK